MGSMLFIRCICFCYMYRDLSNFSAIRKAYEQQKYRFDHDVCFFLDRIVSIFQSHVRPIVRGKAGRKKEYGAKIGVSVVNGFTYIDHLSWDAYNEGSDLMLQIMATRSGLDTIHRRFRLTRYT